MYNLRFCTYYVPTLIVNYVSKTEDRTKAKSKLIHLTGCGRPVVVVVVRPASGAQWKVLLVIDFSS